MTVIFYLVAAVAIACVAVPFVLGARRKRQAQSGPSASPPSDPRAGGSDGDR